MVQKEIHYLVPFVYGVVPDTIWLDPPKIIKVKCTFRQNKKKAMYYPKEGAEFLVQDSIANPNKYLDSASISEMDLTMYYHGLS